MSAIAELPITLDPVTHVYSRGLVTYASVSSVIKSVLPTDYSQISPEVLENARLRGVFVDETFTAWLNGKEPVIPRGTDRDWVNRLQMLVDWWKKQNLEVKATQVTLSDEANLIAGTCDLLGCGSIWDLKVVSELQPAYSLQLGAYASMADVAAVGIIHVTKDRVMVRPYDIDQCRAYWNAALSWHLTKKRLLKS